MAVDLTEGAIAMLVAGAKSEEINPVVQVTDLRLVNAGHTQQNSAERYRMVISDGLQKMQGMLGTNKNDLIRTGKLLKGSVIRMNQFSCNTVQNRLIVLILDLDVLLENCDLIGEPAPQSKVSVPIRSSTDQLGTVTGNTQSFGGNSLSGGKANHANVGGASLQRLGMDRLHGNSYSSNSDSGRYAGINALPIYAKAEPDTGLSSGPSSRSFGDQNMGFCNPRAAGPQPPLNTYTRPPQSGYQQPSPMYSNRGPVARNEAPPRIIPIGALNPYQGRWTIKARVTAKGEVRHYNNPRGDGKVFSFDLLDSDGGEIRVTCFNAVADQFFNQIEVGKVYLISKGTLKPAQKTFNHLHHDHEIFLDSTSTIQPCFEDDSSIPRQQFHFHPISEVGGMENNSIVDIIGVVSFISPAASIMRKNGTETQKRSLQLKDMSGLSVELTLWGNFCNAEGQKLQNICDSGVFPVLAVKSGRVNDFSGKSVGTISTSQLFIEPDFPEAHRLKDWFDKEGRNTPSVSISREISTVGRTEALKTISQIKDERLGTSEKPDWITVNATCAFIKTDTFCYTACPIMIGDRQCNKKVADNGDGKWRCDRCDKSIDECDYRYILQFQIQDHTGLTWVTAFQECGEEIMGIPAKDLHYIKFEEQDDERFAEVIRKVLFTKYILKLKVKEETYSDEQRVKSTVVKAETVNFSSESKFLLDLMDKLKAGDSTPFASKADGIIPNTGMNTNGTGNFENRQVASPVVNYTGNCSNAGREFGLPANQVRQYGNQYSGYRPPATVASGAYMVCNSCGGSGHTSSNCPSIMNNPGESMGGGYGNRISPGSGVAGGASSECFKCHQTGHWARDCPGLGNVPPAYGSSHFNPGRYGGPNQYTGF